MNQTQLKQLEKDLWSAADNLRANSDLNPPPLCWVRIGTKMARPSVR